MTALACPKCGEGSDLLGHEVSGVYDGVLFWSCCVCGHAWARDWTGFGSRQQAADHYVSIFQAARGGAA